MTNLLQNYPSNGKFAIVEFYNYAVTRVAWTEATPSAVSNAINVVNSLRPGGSTNYSAALDRARSIAQQEGDVEQVIFLSDGQPTSGQTSHSAILSRVDNIVSEGARVDTIGFYINENGEDLLEDMAIRGNGSFENID